MHISVQYSWIAVECRIKSCAILLIQFDTAYNIHGGEAHFEGRQQEESSECIGDCRSRVPRSSDRCEASMERFPKIYYYSDVASVHFYEDECQEYEAWPTPGDKLVLETCVFVL